MSREYPKKNSFSPSLLENGFRLRDRGLVALKSGTEVEAMDFAELAAMASLARQLEIPLVVKTGGPEARNDLRRLAELGVDGVIGPMIESPYALLNFTRAVKDIQAGIPRAKNWRVAINIETITAAENFPVMLEARAALELDQITVGRGDLAGSMNLTVDDPEVSRVTRKIIRQARLNGLRTSVGGGLLPAAAAGIWRELEPDTINSRHMVLVPPSTDPFTQVQAALEWETELYQWLETRFPVRGEYYRRRREITRERLGETIL